MIDARSLELIHAELDGENNAAESAELERIMERDAAARALFDELRILTARLDATPAVDPPAHLRAAILDALPQSVETTPARPKFVDRLRAILGPAPVLRYGAVFAAGVLAAVAATQLASLGERATYDPGTLAGTMAERQASAPTAGFRLELDEVSGNVRLTPANDAVAVEFDLETATPIEILIALEGDGLALAGIANRGAHFPSVRAEGRLVSLGGSVDHRYALLLRNTGAAGQNLEVSILAAGKLLHGETMTIPTTE